MITPYTATGRATLLVVPAGQLRVRKLRLPVSLTLPLTTPVAFNTVNPIGGTVLASVAMQNLWARLQGLYNTSTPAATYLVEQNNSGIFNPVESGALTGAGTSAGPDQIYYVATYSFRDTVGHKLKFLVPDQVAYGLAHGPLGVLTGASLLLAQNFLSTTNPSDIGNWARSRGNNPVKTMSFVTSSPNKRYRRQAGLT